MGKGRTDQIIKDIYAAALDPATYMNVLKSWQSEQKSAPKKRPSENNVDAHVQFAIDLLTESDKRWSDHQDALKRDEKSPVHPQIRISRFGEMSHVSAAASKAYSVKEGARLTDLPFDKDQLRRALETCLYKNDVEIIGAQADGADMQTTLIFMPDDDGGVILHSTNFVWPANFSSILQQTYQLTQAESDVLRHIAESRSPTEIAQLRDCQLSTVRSQIKSIYAKIGVTRQAELQMVIYSLAHLISDQTTKQLPCTLLSSPETSQNDDQIHYMILPSGRRLEYAVFGAPQGRPAFYLHDAFFGPYFPPEIVQALIDHGIKIIAPFRPNFGGSDSIETGYVTLDEIAQDIGDLAAHLEINNAPFIARTLGVPYAVGTAIKFPGLVTSITGFAPAMPLSTDADYDNMPVTHRFQVASQKLTPAMRDFAGRIGFSFYRRYGAKRFFEKAYKNIPQDISVLNTPSSMALIEQGASFSAQAGHQGWLGEMQRFYGHERLSYLDCPAPLDFYVGANENNTRAARSQRLTDKGANLSLNIIPGAGELFFYSHPDICTAAILKAFAPFE